jgi:hypothetical protein
MLRFTSRRLRGLALAMVLPVSGCGYLIFGERAGQPPGDRLDWGIVALDAVGLLFGVIPGVIAFAVDFSTGCIYLPPASGYGVAPRDAQPASPSAPAGWSLAARVSPFASDRAIAVALAQHLHVSQEGAEAWVDTMRWQGDVGLPGLPAAPQL